MDDQLDIEIVKSMFSKYNLGEIKGVPEQIKGDVDLNYKITSDQGNTYLLKHIVNSDHIQKFEFLCAVYEFLRKNGVSVPPVYRANNGHFVQNSFILYGYIEGETKKDWSDNEIISLVDNFTKLLLVLKDYEVPDFVKNNDDKYMKGYNIEYCHDVFRPQILQLEIPEDTKTLILETIDLVYSKLSDFNKLPKQLVHGDLNEMNSIFKDGINIGIIDFGVSYDPVIYDPVIYDLGEFCYRFALPWETEEFREDRYELIIKTFEKTLPLSSAEKDLLPYMILRRHMMDIMLALQYYRSNQANMLIPIKTLTEKAIRSSKIIDIINKSNFLVANR